MPGDATIVLPSSSGGPTLDAETYSNASSTTVDRERVASVPGVPTKQQTTPVNVLASASGANVIVAGVGGQTVRVMRMLLVAAAPVNVDFRDGASTILSGPFPLGTNGAIVLDDDGEPWCVTSSGNGFEIGLSAAVNVQTTVWYTQS
jgi:hypothetical protein